VGPIGPLEWEVLEVLWSRAEAVTVRDIEPQFPDLAYTTLMTTLGRLHRKGILERVRCGRAFAYRTVVAREALTTRLAGDALGRLIGRDPESLRPLLSFFIDVAEKQHPDALSEMAGLIRRRIQREDDES
jgi:predicted transcriptional regulator